MINNKQIFLVDGYNLFIRSYMAYPQLNKNGEHVGGVIGFIKKLAELTNIFMPSEVYIIWEGGGSIKRKAIRQSYKEKRTPTKLNRFYKDDLPDSVENQVKQLQLLVGICKFLPFNQIYIENCEGDDVIAHLCKNHFKNENKMILSSDKDMYQLLDDKTVIWDFGYKKIINTDNVYETFKVFPNNFALLKAICGDKSDNIEGVKGVGFKNILKLFPIISGSDEINLEDIISFSASHINESPMYKRCVEQQQFLRENMQLIDISRIILSNNQIQKLNFLIENFNPKFNIYEIKKVLIQNLIDIDSSLFESIMKLTYIQSNK